MGSPHLLYTKAVFQVDVTPIGFYIGNANPTCTQPRTQPIQPPDFYRLQYEKSEEKAWTSFSRDVHSDVRDNLIIVTDDCHEVNYTST